MIAGELLDSYRTNDSGEDDSMHRLTPRQREVLQLIAEENLPNRSPHFSKFQFEDAEAHKANILKALGMRDTAELVQYAIRNGIISV